MLNHIVLVGNLGQDPEMFYSSEGNPVASFSLAFHSSKKTGWIRVVTFKQLAEVVEKNLKKGDRIVIAGSLDQNKWTANDGSPRSTFQILAHDIQFFHEKGEESDFAKEEGSEEVPTH
jgi:single-strand DNA-binding protein